MPKYATDTSVSCESSKAQIERTLSRYGATEFMYGTTNGRAMVAFKMCDRMVRFELSLPERGAEIFKRTTARHTLRSPEEQLKAWEQACRQRWRALDLVIKAKLEAVECGITCFEAEFMAHIIIPDGRTVGDHAIPMIADAYRNKTMPNLLSFGQ